MDITNKKYKVLKGLTLPGETAVRAEGDVLELNSADETFAPLIADGFLEEVTESEVAPESETELAEANEEAETEETDEDSASDAPEGGVAVESEAVPA